METNSNKRKGSWHNERLYSDIALSIEGKLLHEEQTPFQHMQIWDTPRLGRVLVLDGITQTTQEDEFIYHEMMVHPPLLSHPNPKNVLIIGAGDGGILREVLKHPVEKATIVEIDGRVIEACKKYMPSLSAGAFYNERAAILVEDGAEFVKKTAEKYDVVIIDSPDPVGPAVVLFKEEFYNDLSKIVAPSGIIIRQTGSSFYQPDEMPDNQRMMQMFFTHIIAQIAPIPTYHGGFFTFLLGSNTPFNKSEGELEQIAERCTTLNLGTRYYNPRIHFASRVMPNYIQERLAR